MAERPQPNIDEPEVSDVGQPETNDGAAQTLQGLGDFMGNLRKFAQEQETAYAQEAARDQGLEEGTEAAEEGESPDLQEGQSVIARQQRQAAIDSWQAQTKTEAQQKISDIYEQHKADPDMLNKKVEAYRKGVEEKLPQQMIPDFRQSIERWRRTYHQRSKSRFQKKQQAENRQVIKNFHDNQRKALRDMAESDPELAIQDGRLQGGLEEWATEIAKHGPPGEFEFAGQTFEGGNGTLDLDEMNEMYNELRFDVQREVVLAKFKDKETLSEKEKFARNFMEDMDRPREKQKVATGITQTMSDEQRQSIAKQMFGKIDNLAAKQEKDVEVAKETVREAINQFQEGTNYSEKKMAQVKQSMGMIKEYDPQEYQKLKKEYDAARKGQQFYNRAQNWSYSKIVNTKAYLENVDQSEVEMNRRVLDEQIKHLEDIKQSYENNDPLETARNLNGLPDVPAVNITGLTRGVTEQEWKSQNMPELAKKQQEEMTLAKEKFQQRAKNMRTISEKTNRKMSEVAFGDRELAGIKNYLNDDTTTMQDRINLARNIKEGFGNKASYAFKAISEENPVFGHAMGLDLQTKGGQKTAERILRGQHYIKNGIVKMPKEEKVRATIEGMGSFKDVFQELPNTKNNVMKATKAHLAYQRYGSDITEGVEGGQTEILTEGEVRKSFQKVLGAKNVDNEKPIKGGATYFRGNSIVLPENTSQQKLFMYLNGIAKKSIDASWEDLSANGKKPIQADPNGGKSTFKKEWLGDENVNLVTAGNGKYFLEAGEKPVLTDNGERFVLDLSHLGDYTLPKNKFDEDFELNPMPKENEKTENTKAGSGFIEPTVDTGSDKSTTFQPRPTKEDDNDKNTFQARPR